MRNLNKIDSTSKATILNTIAVGQLIRNGANATFKITNITDVTVELTATNGNVGKTCILTKTVFSQLYALKNYTQIMNPKKMLLEVVEARKTGAERFMIK